MWGGKKNEALWIFCWCTVLARLYCCSGLWTWSSTSTVRVHLARATGGEKIKNKNLRDTRVKVVFPFSKSGLLCKEIITLRLLPHVIKGHTFSYRPSSHLKDLMQRTWNNHYYHRQHKMHKEKPQQKVLHKIALQKNTMNHQKGSSN